MPRPPRRPRSTRAGFSLVELLIAMVIGVLVLTSTTAFAMASWKGLSANRQREEVGRNARFLGMSLARDAQMAGVGMTDQSDISSADFGWVRVRGDTLVVLAASRFPAPEFALTPPTGAPNPITPLGEGTCGERCFDFAKQAGGTTPDVEAGRVMLLGGALPRRLGLVTAVDRRGAATDSFSVTLASLPTLFLTPHGLDGGLPLPHGAVLQPLSAVAYWRQDSTIMRAERYNADGSYRGEVMADGVEGWQVRLIFADGGEAAVANPADTARAYNRIVSVVVRARLRSSYVDPRVNGGLPVARDYEWRVTPRNLSYERNRLP
ncbi:MAG: prepilin-type N-terminal cleavage/methylation domain-containing protein [Gemmatimonadales bacterium]|nr:prepilin-type N-terminal cleavage/methylation domain-containing protein [Gemmatimonadales bacterium]